MKRKVFGIHNLDARDLDEILEGNLVDVTITSPPYFDLKDYGVPNQIGYGQDYAEYLEDLKLVFQKVYSVTKDTGSLWIIIDTFRKDGEVVTLPFDFANAIKEVGWKLQEIIIWGKDRTVPWTHKGQMRNMFEYVLMFAKDTNYKFYIDEVRDYESLKKWWVKYPERYNPLGKAPDGIWNFDIPTQGSWGNGYIRHFCPLPEEMIAQILKLTTREGDVVLDPFAGSGAVLFQADVMKRKHIGFEINPEFIQMFKNYLKKTQKKKITEYELSQKNLIKRDLFQSLILDLRSLKYARILYQSFVKIGISKQIKILVLKESFKPQKKNSFLAVKYVLFCKDLPDSKLISESIESLISKPPLSRFGIVATIQIIKNLNEFIKQVEHKKLYIYNIASFYKYKKKFEIKDISGAATDAIITEIKLDLDEKNYA